MKVNETAVVGELMTQNETQGNSKPNSHVKRTRCFLFERHVLTWAATLSFIMNQSLMSLYKKCKVTALSLEILQFNNEPVFDQAVSRIRKCVTRFVVVTNTIFNIFYV